jgi:UDP-glucose 4-epimerase
VEGVLLASDEEKSNFEIFNLSTPDFVDVDEIALMVINELQIDPQSVKITYSGGDRGWKADVPVVRLDARKIIKLGWNPKFNSREAIRESIRGMIQLKYE